MIKRLINNEKIYHEFASWKLENDPFIKKLKKSSEKFIDTFNYVLMVLDYLYSKMVDELSFYDEEINIFKTGFLYVIEKVEYLKNILDNQFNGKTDLFYSRAKEVSLILLIKEFQSEISNNEKNHKESLEKLKKFERKIINIIEQNAVFSIKLYQEFDNITFEIFSNEKDNPILINDIYYEIAEQYEII
jgi:hypothetical protein